MSSSAPPAVPAKPSASSFWKWLMRLTGTFALLLFLTPTFYVVKYFTIDKPREDAMPLSPFLAPQQLPSVVPLQADYLSWLEKRTKDDPPEGRIAAISMIGNILRQPGINWKRPMECLLAKAALAELATKDADPSVRAAASAELGTIAQNGAVLRR